MRNYVMVIVLMFSLEGCAGVTDVTATGGDSYMVASHGTMGWSSGGAQKAKAFTEANEFCKSQGKKLEAISSSDSGNGGFGKISSAEVSFRCVAP